eukprot:5549687-Pleurochrysis_carterae.AAC.1
MHSLSDDALSDACLGDGSDWDAGAGSTRRVLTALRRCRHVIHRAVRQGPRRVFAVRRTGSCLNLLRVAEALDDGDEARALVLVGQARQLLRRPFLVTHVET